MPVESEIASIAATPRKRHTRARKRASMPAVSTAMRTVARFSGTGSRTSRPRASNSGTSACTAAPSSQQASSGPT